MSCSGSSASWQYSWLYPNWRTSRRPRKVSISVRLSFRCRPCAHKRVMSPRSTPARRSSSTMISMAVRRKSVRRVRKYEPEASSKAMVTLAFGPTSFERGWCAMGSAIASLTARSMSATAGSGFFAVMVLVRSGTWTVRNSSPKAICSVRVFGMAGLLIDSTHHVTEISRISNILELTWLVSLLRLRRRYSHLTYPNISAIIFPCSTEHPTARPI